jgi:hypothetical protein
MADFFHIPKQNTTPFPLNCSKWPCCTGVVPFAADMSRYVKKIKGSFILILDLGTKLCLRSEDAFVIICVANLMEVKVLYVQQDMRYEISSYWRFNV